MLGAVARLTGMSSHPVASALHAALERHETTGSVAEFSEIPHFGLRGTWRAGTGSANPVGIVLGRFGAWEGMQEERASAFEALALEAPRAEDLPAENTPLPQSCLFVDGKLAALVWLGEEIKPGAAELLRGLEARGLAVELLSGDHPDRVADFAARCGFCDFRGGLSPEEKQVAARAFQARHGAALAVGDGYNDSLLFGEAAVSLAVQGAAGPVAAEADAFMTASEPEAVLSLLRVAEGTRRSLRNCYIVSGVYNTAAISLAVAGLVSPLTAAILMPFASLSLCLTAWVTVPKK
jgi:cation transport ATPase